MRRLHRGSIVLKDMSIDDIVEIKVGLGDLMFEEDLISIPLTPQIGEKLGLFYDDSNGSYAYRDMTILGTGNLLLKNAGVDFCVKRIPLTVDAVQDAIYFLFNTWITADGLTIHYGN